jgi:hypothetical protein
METTHLSAFLGDSASLAIPLEWLGASFDPGEDWTLIFTAKKKASDLDAAAIIQKGTGLGITSSAGLATVALVPDDTVDIKVCNLFCDVQAQHIDTGEVRTVGYARLELLRDITRDTEISIPVITTEAPSPIAGAVRYDAEQTLTNGQKTQALENIGVPALTFAGSDPNAAAVPNFLETTQGGPGNNDIRYEQVDDNLTPPSVTYSAGSVFAVLTISVVGRNITVSCPSNIGLITTLASAVITAINGDPTASTMVNAANKSGSDGSGTLYAAGGPYALSGGSDAGPTATHLGQLCKASTAWWQWNGTVWLPVRTLENQPIMGESPDYYKMTRDGDGAFEFLPFP